MPVSTQSLVLGPMRVYPSLQVYSTLAPACIVSLPGPWYTSAPFSGAGSGSAHTELPGIETTIVRYIILYTGSGSAYTELPGIETTIVRYIILYTGSGSAHTELPGIETTIVRYIILYTWKVSGPTEHPGKETN